MRIQNPKLSRIHPVDPKVLALLTQCFPCLYKWENTSTRGILSKLFNLESLVKLFENTYREYFFGQNCRNFFLVEIFENLSNVKLLKFFGGLSLENCWWIQSSLFKESNIHQIQLLFRWADPRSTLSQIVIQWKRKCK